MTQSSRKKIEFLSCLTYLHDIKCQNKHKNDGFNEK